MDRRGLAAGWKEHLVLGFQAVVAGVAVAIISQLVMFVIVGLDAWLMPGFLESIPSGIRTTITVAFFVLILLPLYGLFIKQMGSNGGLHTTIRGRVKNGRWHRRNAVE